MKNFLHILILIALAISCSLPDSGGLENSTISEPKIESKKDSTSVTLNRPQYQSNAISSGLKYYFKGSNNSNIYRSNISSGSCASFPESINTLGNGATSQYGPGAVIFNGKIYLFHKGYNNNYIYYTTSSDGVSWSSDVQLGNGAATLGGISATVFDNKIYVAHQAATGGDTKIYLSSSSNGTSWGTETSITNALNYDYIPWIFSKNGTLYILHAYKNNTFTFILRLWHSTNGTTWSLGNNVSPSLSISTADSYQNTVGFSIAINPNSGLACVLYNYDHGTIYAQYSSNLTGWTTPTIVKSIINGQNAQSHERPVITWDNSCNRFFAVWKGYTGNNIYKAYPDSNGILWENGTLIGTTTHGPYVISN